MTCPSSDVLNQLNYAASLPGGAPLSSDNQACYNLLNNDDAAYKRQYDSAGAGGGVSAVSLNPQPGTAPVPTSLIGSIFNLVGAGANAYQAMQVGALKAHVQGTGAQLCAACGDSAGQERAHSNVGVCRRGRAWIVVACGVGGLHVSKGLSDVSELLWTTYRDNAVDSRRD